MKPLPHPVEARRARSGTPVRLAYGLAVLSLAVYLAWSFGRQLLFLEGTGEVDAPRYVVSTPYISQVRFINVAPGLTVAEGDIIATVTSQQLDQQINDLERVLVEQSQTEAELRIRLRIASATTDATRDRLAIAGEAFQRLDADRAGVTSLSYRMDVYRERALANIEFSQAEAETDETRKQLDRLERNRAAVQAKIDAIRAGFDGGQIKAPVDGLVGSTIANPGEVIRPGDLMLEIFDLSQSYIAWHVPAFSLRQPNVADVVYVHYGSRVLPGYVWDIQQLAETTPEGGQSILRARERQQVILVRLLQSGLQLPVHAQVTVRMNYSGLAEALVETFLGKPQ